MEHFKCEVFTKLGDEVLDDFFDCLVEFIEEIEMSCIKLEMSHDKEELNHLFRSMHSVKGNCRMVFLEPLVDICHQMEEVVSDIRDEKIEYKPEIGEWITVLLNLIHDLLRSLRLNGEAEQQRLDNIGLWVATVRNASPSEIKNVADHVLDIIATGIGSSKSELVVSWTADNNTSSQEPVGPKTKSDLAFFYSLAQRLDGLSLYKRDRTAEVLKVCLQINNELPISVDESQLTAAIYMHDFGMSLLSRKLIDKDILTPVENTQFYEHTQLGADIVYRMEGWHEASVMIAEHHECYDGSGYPKKLSGDMIHPGAMILAVFDAYQQVLYNNSDVNFRKTLLRAVSEVNSNSGTLYSPEVVEAFNLVIRKQFIAIGATK
jgi:two-component system response regulator RpfG